VSLCGPGNTTASCGGLIVFMEAPSGDASVPSAGPVTALPWFWNRPDTNQQIVVDGQVYTRVNAPPGYGVEVKEAEPNGQPGDPGTTIADVRYRPLSEKKDLQAHVYVNVVSGTILRTPDEKKGADDEEQRAAQKQAEAAARMQEWVRQYTEKLLRGEDPGSPIPPWLEKERDDLIRQYLPDRKD
jgi:hypothetical protein